MGLPAPTSNRPNSDAAVEKSTIGRISVRRVPSVAFSPVATIAVVTVTAMAIVSALPHFRSVPTHFLSGAAARITLIDTAGTLAGFSAPYITSPLSDATGRDEAPMSVVGFVLLLSAVLMSVTARKDEHAPLDAPIVAL